jgi:hypothetical protein
VHQQQRYRLSYQCQLRQRFVRRGHGIDGGDLRHQFRGLS